MKLPIYLDYNATTPVDPRVVERMLPFFTEQFGNASSKGHPFGWAAEEAVEQARQQIASGIGATPEEITFTSGATEAANLALKGAAAAYARKGRHIVTVQTEHKAVLDTCQTLERDGFNVTYLPVHPSGLLNLEALEAALTDETILVSVMWANNETGVIQPIADIADRVRSRGILLMTDATQALGKIPVTTEHVDVMVASGHKVYGPKGIGFLYARRRHPRVRLVPQVDGGGQERNLRGGTLNVPGIVGMGAAIEIAVAALDEEAARLRALRGRLESELQTALPGIQINGHTAPRLPQTSNITFPGVPADKLILALRDLAVSTGSACSSGSGKPSHVLKALGLSDEQARASLRFSLGRFTTDAEIDYAIPHIVEAVESLNAKPIPQSAIPNLQ